MTVGIFGYGRFGKLLAAHLAKRTDVLVCDTAGLPRTFPSRRIRTATPEEAASQPIVILAVPVSSLRRTLLSVRKFLRPGALVLDVCAVKMQPVQWMKSVLPRTVQILGTHPLFGPDSAAGSLKNHRVYVCPVRLSRSVLGRVIRLLKSEGLIVEIITPRAHDRKIAVTLFLTQFVGRFVGRAGLARRVVSTKSYDDLLRLVKIADNDTGALFRDMVRFNPYARQTLKTLKEAHKAMMKELL